MSQKLSKFAYDLKIEKIPKNVIEKAKLHILDLLGIILAVNEFSNNLKVINLFKEMGGNKESTVLGTNIKIPAMNASFVNSYLSHSVDYDDTHLASAIHQSTTIVPTALALAEKLNKDGKEMLEAVIAGYEVNARIGLIAPWKFHLRGFHPTSTVGVFGATITAGKLLDLNEEQLTNALGIAGSMASGILQGIVEGVAVKPFHPAIASHLAIIATNLAKLGFLGPKEIFEGKFGIFNTYLKGEEFLFENAIKDLGENWETLNISLKPYPACHATHSSIDIARIFRDKYKLSLDEVESINFYVPKICLDLVAEPIEEKLRPSTPYSAKFSLHYTVIKAFQKGWVGIWDFTEESIKDENTLKYMKIVKVYYEKSFDKYGDKVIPAKAVVFTKDGKKFEETVINHKGTPDNPLTKEEVITKFEDNLNPTVYSKVKKEIIEIVLNIENRKIIDLIETISLKS
jgi:2-methylcitrate dehydratase PrpD